MATEIPQQPINTEGLASVNNEEEIPILDMRLDIVEDIPAELEDFIFLSRLGIFEEAKGLFEQNMKPYISFFPVLAEYADMLLEEGLYDDLTQLLTSLDSTHYSESERNLLDLIKALSKAYSEQSLIQAQGEQVDERPMIEAALNLAKDWHKEMLKSPPDVSGLQIHTLEIYLSIGVLANFSSCDLDTTYYKLPWSSATDPWDGCIEWLGRLLQEHKFWEAQRIFAILNPVLPPGTVSDMFKTCCDSLRRCPQTEVSAIAELTAINAYSSWVLQKSKQWKDEGIRLRLVEEAIFYSLEATRLFPALFGEQATFRGRCFCEWLENLQMLPSQVNLSERPIKEIPIVKTLRMGELATSWQLFISDIRLFSITFLIFPPYFYHFIHGDLVPWTSSTPRQPTLLTSHFIASSFSSK
ncbi:hypothetical protein NXS19_011280 [Fusarium pseudograminearum]|nr:hypothetical protein NXS19_011280 [Fusarium pseudograminearum]